MLILTLILSPILYLVEKHNKKTSPIFPIVCELFIFYVSWLVHKKNYSLFYKFIFTTGSLLHFFRLVLNHKRYYKLSLLNQLLGIIGTISLGTKYYFIDAIIKLFISCKNKNDFGFNILIDPLVTIVLLFTVFYKKLIAKDEIIRNFLSSDLIYHILEIIFIIVHKLIKK